MSGVAGNISSFHNWKEMVMMNALIVATLCSVVLMSAPVAMRSYVYAHKKGPRKRPSR